LRIVSYPRVIKECIHQGVCLRYPVFTIACECVTYTDHLPNNMNVLTEHVTVS